VLGRRSLDRRGDDAKPYQEREVRRAIAESETSVDDEEAEP
jgi:hypothetical protein